MQGLPMDVMCHVPYAWHVAWHRAADLQLCMAHGTCMYACLQLTSASSTLDLPLLWPPMTATCGRLSFRSTVTCEWCQHRAGRLHMEGFRICKQGRCLKR